MNDTGCVLVSDTLAHAAEALRKVYIWVLVVLGLPGDVAAVVTILSMPVTTATFYVALLSTVDGLALVLKLLYHQLVTYDSFPDGGAGCRVLNMTVELCSCYANWVLVLICCERFITVRFPLKKRVYFTTRKAFCSAAVCFLVLFLSFSPFLFVERFCNDSSNPHADLSPSDTDTWLTIQTLLYFVLPLVIVAILATLIIVYLQQYRRVRQLLQSGTKDAERRNEQALSIMLICAAVAFLILTLPTCVYHLIGMERMCKWLPASVAYMLLQVAVTMADANHSVNFYVYFVSTVKFRDRFLELVTANRRRCCRMRTSSSSTPSSDAQEGARDTAVDRV